MFGLYPPRKTSLLLIGALALSSGVCAQTLAPPFLSPNFGESLAQAPGEAWVPVVVLSEQGVPRNVRDPVLLGFAQVKDIEDGFPYKVGLYRLGLASPVNTVPGLTLSAEITQLQLTPVCRAQVVGPEVCQPLVGLLGTEQSSQVEIAANYQIGAAQFRVGLGQAEQHWTTALNPYLPWPRDSKVAFIPGVSGVQNSIQLQSSLDTDYGRFGLGMGLAQAPLRSQDYHQGHVNFNWFKGAFGTTLSTRLMELTGTSSLWGGLDLGLTWRTPWQGTLSVGARNLVVSGKPPAMLDPAAAIEAESTERVPYVRYQQDL